MSTTDFGMRRTPVRPASGVGHLPRTDGTRPSRPASTARRPVASGVRPVRRCPMLIRVRGALPSLRPAEQRVAEAVLADPAGVSERSITSLARLCRTSETTVLRFCRALGLAGYPELRIALARAAQGEENDRARGHRRSDSVIIETDSLAEMVAKITYADQRSVADTGAAVDVAALEAAVDAVARARRVDVYGVGASALVGQELHARLHRLGRRELRVGRSARRAGLGGRARARRRRDRHLPHGDDDRRPRLAPGRPQPGRHDDRDHELRPGTDRRGQSDVVLTTAARETTFRTGAMSSRVSQLVLVDCLFTGVAMRSYDRSVSALDVGPLGAAARHTERHERPTAAARPGLRPPGRADRPGLSRPTAGVGRPREGARRSRPAVVGLAPGRHVRRPASGIARLGRGAVRLDVVAARAGGDGVLPGVGRRRGTAAAGGRRCRPASRSRRSGARRGAARPAWTRPGRRRRGTWS